MHGGRRGEQSRGDSLSRKTDRDDPATMHAVGAMPGDERRGESRNELKESDEPKIPGTGCQVIHVPADREQYHLLGRDRADASRHEPCERRLLQQS